MHFSIADGEAVDLQRKELLDLLRPGFVDTDLRILFAWRIYEINFWFEEIDIADESAIEDRTLLYRKINQRCGKEWDRHMPGGFYDLHMVDLVSAAPKMHRHGRDMAAIFGHFG